MKRLFGLLLVAALSSCGSPDPQSEADAMPSQSATPAKAAAQSLPGFRVPGSALDAKAMGFTDCSSDYYAATCKKAEAELFDFKSPATIRMDLEEGKMPNDLSQLHYTAIDFEVDQLTSTYPCKQEGPLACAVGPLGELGNRLLSSGWKVKEWKSYLYFVHPSYNAKITIKSVGGITDAGLSISGISREEVAETIAQIDEKAKSLEAQSKAAQDFNEKMREGAVK